MLANKLQKSEPRPFLWCKKYRNFQAFSEDPNPLAAARNDSR